MGFRALEQFDLWTEMNTHHALPMQTPAGNCFSNLRVSSSLPILPTDSEDKSNLSDPFHVSLEREIVTYPSPANAHPFIHRSGSVTHTYPSASGFPTDIHFSFSPPERPSHDPAFISQSSSEGASLPTHLSSGSAAGFITYPKEDDDNSWSTDQLQRLLDFPDHVPASCSRVERISGLILSEEHTKRTDWQDLAEQLLDDDPTDPTWSNFLADSSVADHQSKVPQSSSNISVYQPQIQQHHPLLSRDMTNVANPVSNAPLNKPRMRWTPELHEAFIEAVNQLGGSERATPKGILMFMNVEGLTIYQVKSHLQKYRTARFKPEASEGSSDSRNTCGHVASLDWNMSMDITEALRLQMEVQKQLHEQLEIQRKLQLQIEEQGKCLLQMLENQNKLEQEKSVASSFPAAISISNAIDSVKSEGSELDHLKAGAPGENSHSLKGKKKMPESVTRDDHYPDASGGPGSPSMKRARIDDAN